MFHMLGEILRGQPGPVLVTGNTGFKGSWLTLLLETLGVPQVGYALEPEKNSLFRFLALDRRVYCKFGDVREETSVEKEFLIHEPSVVIHMAAQSLVLKSYEEPRETFDTNIMGTINVLQAARRVKSVKVVLVITTDKVYRNDGFGRRFIETDSLMGKDPYSASKVATESVCVAWNQLNLQSSGPKILVARAGNVIGGGDTNLDRLIPDIVRSLQNQKTLQIRNMTSTRPWQHVLDPLVGYIKYLEAELGRTNPPPALNFGPREASKNVAYVVQSAQKHFGNQLKYEILPSKTTPQEAHTLDLDSSLAETSLAWAPMWDQDLALDRTFDWWKKVLQQEATFEDCCKADIRSYFEGES